MQAKNCNDMNINYSRPGQQQYYEKIFSIILYHRVVGICGLRWRRFENGASRNVAFACGSKGGEEKRQVG